MESGPESLFIHLVGKITVIVQVEESIKIKHEFILLKLCQFPIVAGVLRKNLDISHSYPPRQMSDVMTDVTSVSPQQTGGCCVTGNTGVSEGHLN